MQLSTGTLARASARHPWRTLVVWAVTFVAAGILHMVGDTRTTESEFTNDPESQRAAALLEERLRGPGDDTEFVVVTGASEVTDPAYRGYVGELQAAVAALGPDVVTQIGSYLTDDGPV